MTITWFIIVLGVFIILNALDLHSTLKVVSRLGLHSERNPIARQLFRWFGLRPGLYILKGSLLVLLPAIIYFAANAWQEAGWALFVADLAYMLVVGNNYRIWYRLRRRDREIADFVIHQNQL